MEIHDGLVQIAMTLQNLCLSPSVTSSCFTSHKFSHVMKYGFLIQNLCL
jgi:hypothetical protein